MGIIKIRPAKQSDLPTLLEFEQGIIVAERPMDPTLKPGKISYYDIEALLNETNVKVLVAEFDGELVGSGYARIVESDHYRTHSQHAYLRFMFVSPAHRGKGINKLIIDHLRTWTLEQGVFEMQLEVYHNNPSAIRAYEKAGFSMNLVRMRIGLKD